MGKLNGSNRAPTPQSVRVTPAATIEPVSGEVTAEQAATKSRKQGLLRRSRGLFGTVLTGFRGFFNSNKSGEKEARKTLLGE